MTDEFIEWAKRQLANQLKVSGGLLTDPLWVENKQENQPETLARIVRHYAKLSRMYDENIGLEGEDSGRM